jgi:hypothetical protein
VGYIGRSEKKEKEPNVYIAHAMDRIENAGRVIKTLSLAKQQASKQTRINTGRKAGLSIRRHAMLPG